MYIKLVDKKQYLEIILNKRYSNDLNLDILLELLKLLQKLERSKCIHIIVFKSAMNNIFSSGLNLKELVHTNFHLVKVFNISRAVGVVFKICKQILTSKHIYIAQINGAVIGSAAAIVLACDYVIGHKKAWMWLPDSIYGGLQTDGTIQLLEQKFSYNISRDMSFCGSRVNFSELLRMGIINREYLYENEQEIINEVVEMFSTKSLLSLSKTKKILNSNIHLKIFWRELYYILCDTEVYTRLECIYNIVNKSNKLS